MKMVGDFFSINNDFCYGYYTSFGILIYFKLEDRFGGAHFYYFEDNILFALEEI